MMWSTATDGSLPGVRSEMQARAVLERRFDHLMQEHGAALGRLAGSYTNDASDRDDLLQEIAVALWQALPRFREECSERTFLFRIAHNRAIAFLARHRSQRVSTREEIELLDPRPGPEAELLREEEGERLVRAVRRLPVVYRQVVTLALEGMEYGEIAEILGTSESNIGARLSRARQMLRRILEPVKCI